MLNKFLIEDAFFVLVSNYGRISCFLYVLCGLYLILIYFL